MQRPSVLPSKNSWYSLLSEARSTPGPLRGPEGLCQKEISPDIIENRTRDLPACSTVPQPTASPRGPGHHKSVQSTSAYR